MIKKFLQKLEQTTTKNRRESHEEITNYYFPPKLKVSTDAHNEIYKCNGGNKIRKKNVYHLGVVPVVPLLEDETSAHYSGL